MVVRGKLEREREREFFEGRSKILRSGLFFSFMFFSQHPGNIAVDDANGGGRLIFYDFGMMGR
jgi:hypothetical protein